MADRTTKDEILQRASAIARRVQIDKVRLVHSTINRDQISNPKGDVEIEFAFKTPQYEFDDDTKALLVLIALMTSGKDGTSEVFRIEAFFALHYSVHDSDPVSLEDLQAFASANGLFNIWPYWREYAQSSAARMGLDSVVMPVLTSGMVVQMLQSKNNEIGSEVKLTHTLRSESKRRSSSRKKPKGK